MMGRNGACLRRITVGLVLAAGMVLAACGDDDEESASGGGSGSPQTVTIKATGTEKAPEFEVTTPEVKAGAATIEIQNGLEKGVTDAQLVYVDGERSDKEIVAMLGNAMRGKPVADWFQGGGGPGTAKAGETVSVTQELKQGNYYIASGGDGKPQLPLAKVAVSGEGGDPLEEPAAKVTATEYGFKASGVKSGEPVLFDNAGKEWHHFLAARLTPGSTIEDARKFLMTEKGKPPLEEEGPGSGIESTVLDGGVSQVYEFDAKPGKYAFFCFIADKKGGPPHVAKGMVSEVTVE